jgi:AcrR family transcriptional regulator
MTSSADNGSTASARRRPYDARASREALLDAAGALFDERGYEAATVREIGERAGVDAALIARYFGSKEGLYLATVQRERPLAMPSDPAQVLARLLNRSEQRGIGPIPLAMVSPTLSEAMRAQVQEILAARVVAPLSEELAARGVADARLHAELLVATATGIALTRAGGTLPALAAAPLEDVVALLAPFVAAVVGEEEG